MDFKKLRYFVSVVEAGSFRRASQALKIAQPALTRQIHALEDELGVQLLSRSNTGVIPTAKGELLLNEAREILARTYALRERLSPQGEQVEGEVRLGLPSVFADALFGSIVELTQAKYPNLRIICQEGASGLIENIENGSLDLAIASVAGERTMYQCDLEHLITEQNYFVTLARHMPACLSTSIACVLRMPLVLTPRPNARRQYLDDAARKSGIPLHVVAEAATMSAQFNLVLRGVGSAILPISATRLMACHDDIRLIPINDLQSDRVLLHSRKTTNPFATQAIAEQIRILFNEMLAES